MTDEPAAPDDQPAHTRPGPFPPTIDRPQQPHRPQPIIEGVVVADSAPPRGPVVTPQVVAPSGLPSWQSAQVGAATRFEGQFIQEPVAGSFIGGAVYAVIVRTLCFLLSGFYILPVNGLLSSLIRGNRPAFAAFVLGEFLLLGAGAVAALVVGVTAKGSDRASILRAHLFGLVYFWANVYYFATVLIIGGAVIIWDTVPGGIWLYLVSLLNIPLLFFSRTIIRRTRWASGREA